MKRRILIAWLIIFFLSFISGVYAQDDDFSDPWVINFDGRSWVIGNKHFAPPQKIIEYVLDGESIGNWSELIRSSFSEEVNDSDASRAIEDFVTRLNQDCPQVEVNFIQENSEGAVFEWEFNDCPGHERQYEIIRISKSGRTIYTLEYINKTPGFSEEEKTHWIGIIGNAYIKTEPEIITKSEDPVQATENPVQATEEKTPDHSISRNYDKSFDSTIEKYSRAIEKNPQDAQIYCKRAMAYGQKGDLEQAIADLSRAIEIDPELVEAYSNRGIIYTIKKDLEKAFADHSKVIELTPDNPYAYHNRAFIYLKEGQYDESIADNTRAIELNPELAEAYGIRGFAYFMKKQYDQAVFDLSKGIELSSPQSVHLSRMYYRRAQSYFLLKEINKSWDDLRKAEELGYQSVPRFVDNLRKASGRQ